MSELKHGTISGYVNHKCKCSECKSAINAYNREYYKNNLKYRHKSSLQKHGTYATPGICDVCNEFSDKRNVDHDHSCCSGAKSCDKCRRGFVCHRCNLAIGILEKAPDLLDKIEKYILNPPGVEGR